MKKQWIKATGNILSITIDAEITNQKYDTIAKALDRIIASFGSVKLVLVVKHYVSFNSAEEFCDNLRFVQVYSDHIDRAVVLSDREAKRTWTAIFGLFSGVRMEFFPMADFERAWAWLTNGVRQRTTSPSF
jgi:hypothetical protein